MNHRYRSSDESLQIWFYLGLLVCMIFYYIWFYAVKHEGTGVIADKWTEVSCSTDKDGDTSCTTKYLVQFENGDIFGVFWKPHWDRMIAGNAIRYVARGRFISFFGWRIAQPDIFSFEVIPKEQLLE